MTLQVDPEGTELKYLRRYADFAAKRMRALEVGCGDGRLTWLFAGEAASVTGVDLRREDLRLAMADRPASLAKRIAFAESDAVHLPFAKNSFDLAIFSWSF